MKTLLALLACLSIFFSYSQNHSENISAIKTVDQANKYAASFREVSVSLVNAEKDVIFFDDIDTSDLSKYVGTSKTLYGRTIKLIQDSIIDIINVQVISFDLSKTSKEMANLLLGQISKKMDAGESFWELKKKYAHTSAVFSSSPEPFESIKKKYSLGEDALEVGEKSNWETTGSEDQVGLLIVEKGAHPVRAFYTISYLNLANVR
ncbi:MAG: hypothetical protein ACJAUD_001882 [Crocinitomicaceae bacterium]|jgi:hypothetical protein